MEQNENSSRDPANVIERNVNALLHHKKEEASKRNFREILIDSVMVFISSMISLFIHTLILLTWVVWNMGWIHVRPFDPRFTILETLATIEAIFLTTFVLIGQKRLKMQADKWAELDLQVSLLTEHELTRVMTLVTAIAKKMDIQEAENKEIEELSKDIHPEKVLDAMEQAKAPPGQNNSTS